MHLRATGLTQLYVGAAQLYAAMLSLAMLLCGKTAVAQVGIECHPRGMNRQPVIAANILFPLIRVIKFERKEICAIIFGENKEEMV